MTDNLQYLFFESVVTRNTIYSLTTLVLIFYLADKMLERHHSRIPVIAAMIVKTLMWYPFELYFHVHPELDPDSNPAMIIYSFWRVLIVTGLFVWTYSNNRGKSGLTMIIGETGVALLTFPVLAVLNFIERRPSLTQMAYPFMALDLLMPLLFWLMWKIIKRPALYLAARYRAWSPKRPWMLWSLFLLYWASAAVSGAAEETTNRELNNYMYYHQIWGAGAMVLFMVWILYQEKQESVRHEYLMKQASLAGTYDRIIEKNRASAAGMQQQIREQMDEISRQVQSGRQVESTQIQNFLEQLRQEAGSLQIESVYCGNYLVDAVLCMQGEMLEKLGYRKDFECVGVPAEMEDQSLVPQILELIFEEWLEQHDNRNASEEKQTMGDESEKVCRLSITGTGGQLLITANISRRWHAGRRRLMKRLLVGCEGVFNEGNPFLSYFSINHHKTGHIFCSDDSHDPLPCRSDAGTDT